MTCSLCKRHQVAFMVLRQPLAQWPKCRSDRTCFGCLMSLTDRAVVWTIAVYETLAARHSHTV